MTERQLRQIDQKLNGEAERQMAIIFPATAMCLHNLGWGNKKIENFFEETNNTFDECGAGGLEVSMIQMLYEETGIDLKVSPNGKSWRELCFLNHEIKLGTKESFTPEQWYAMRVRQIQWVAPAILASELIALHRKYRFSIENLAKLAGCIDDTRQLYHFKAKALSRACYEATGIEIRGGRYDRAN